MIYPSWTFIVLTLRSWATISLNTPWCDSNHSFSPPKSCQTHGHTSTSRNFKALIFSFFDSFFPKWLYSFLQWGQHLPWMSIWVCVNLRVVAFFLVLFSWPIPESYIVSRLMSSDSSLLSSCHSMPVALRALLVDNTYCCIAALAYLEDRRRECFSCVESGPGPGTWNWTQWQTNKRNQTNKYQAATYLTFPGFTLWGVSWWHSVEGRMARRHSSAQSSWWGGQGWLCCKSMQPYARRVMFSSAEPCLRCQSLLCWSDCVRKACHHLHQWTQRP